MNSFFVNSFWCGARARMLVMLVFGFCRMSGQELTEIDIPGLLKTEKSPGLSEIASGIQFLKLQTTPDCLIESVGSVARWGDQFLISANGGKALFVFGKDGKFVKTVSALGKGPGEYVEIYGMNMDTKTGHLFILDNGQVKLMEFDEAGKFIREFKLGFYATGVKVADDGFWFYTGSLYAYRTDGCLITVTDRNGKVIKRYHKRPPLKAPIDRNAWKYSDRGDWCYWEPYWDTVYAFNGSAYHPKYFFNVGKKRIPQEYLESRDMFRKDLDGYQFIMSFLECRSFLSFEFIDKGREGKRLVYDKKSRAGYWIPYNEDFRNWGFMNDFCGGPLYRINTKMSMDELVTSYQVVDLKDYLAKGLIDPKRAKNQALYKEFTDLIKNSAVDDNPILVIAQLK
jgi:hypothetical protein